MVYKIVDTKRKKENPFVALIQDRIKNNKNCIMAIVGGTGSGKSYTALALAEMLNPPVYDKKGKLIKKGFSIDQVVFHGNEFLKLVRSDMDKGSVIIFDEAGIDMQSRSFMTFLNKTLSAVMQTVRYKNHIIILTVPEISFVDKQIRNLLHVLLVTAGINKRARINYVKPYLISTAKTYDKTYNPHPKFKDRKIGMISVGMLRFKKPSVKLQHSYEKKKRKFGDILYKEAEAALGKDELSANKLSERERTVFEASKCGSTADGIAKNLGLNINTIYNIRSKLRKKGYTVPKD